MELLIRGAISTAVEFIQPDESKKQHEYKHEWVDLKKKKSAKKIDSTDATNDQENKKFINQMKQKYPYQDKQTDEVDIKEEMKNDNVKNVGSDKVAIVVIGNSGVGKSSLIRLLSGDKDAVKISAGSERGTSSITNVASKYNDNLYYIDTVGLQDSDSKWTDPTLLKRTLQYIHRNDFNKIKILLCVSGDTKTRKGLFIHPAKFVGSLKVDNEDEDDGDDDKDDDKEEDNKNNIRCNPTDDAEEDNDTPGDDGSDETKTDAKKKAKSISVWDSVLIIKKEGDPEADVSGVHAAALSCGATNDFKSDEHFFGFKCTDWNNFDGKNDRWYRKLDEHEYENFGYFTEQRAKATIEDKLKKLPIFTLNFQPKSCIRCGAEADPRFSLFPCHTNAEMTHSSSLMRRHLEVQVLKHRGDVIQSTGVVGHYHSGYRQNKHSGSKQSYHPKGKSYVSTSRVLTGVFTVSLSEWAIWSSEDWYYYNCCNKYKGDSSGCKYRWSCCKKDPSNTVCGKAPETMSCCGKISSSTGCTKKSGNVQLWGCCNKPINEKGCELIWRCCNRQGDGCDVYYPCCNQNEKAEGCIKTCANCRVSWGKPKGCVIAE